MSLQPDYASITRHDPNPVKRWLQNRRLTDAMSLLGGRRPALSIDYGAGDGELTRLLRQAIPEGEVICFEPSMQLLAQAQAHVGGLAGVKLTSEIAGLTDACADAIFCLEVFEHLPSEETQAALAQMARLLKPGGVLIIGVPVETGPVARVKGWFRGLRRDDFDTDKGRIAQAARGQIGFERFRVDFEGGGGYYPHHLGFDHRVLLKALDARFIRKINRPGPFPVLPVEWNSELTVLLMKR